MTVLPHFPPVRLARFEVEEHPYEPGVFEVVPLTERQPHDHWRGAFSLAAEDAEDIDWLPSGAARCTADDDVERVKDRLDEIAADTNDRLAARLAQVEQQAEREELESLRAYLQAEIDSASVDSQARYRLRYP